MIRPTPSLKTTSAWGQKAEDDMEKASPYDLHTLSHERKGEQQRDLPGQEDPNPYDLNVATSLCSRSWSALSETFDPY